MNNFQDAFISYGRADSKAFASQLYTRFLERGLKVWFDQNDIPLGVDYQKQIDDGLEKSDNFLFIIAPHSINSPYCGLEVELALRRKKRIIPILHVEQITEETWQKRNPGRSLSEWEDYKAKGKHSSFPNMHPAIGKINWVYMREGIDDFEKSFAGLLEIFQRDRDYVHEHTYLLAKALEWERHQKQSRYLLTGAERLKAETWLKLRFKDRQPPCEPTDLHCEFICESIKNSENLMTQVFLSYSDQDRGFMQKVAKTLMREGMTVWTNRTDIKSGVEYGEVIDRGIEQADNMVFLMSKAALKSVYCQKELNYARSLNKRIIPLLIEEVDSQEILPELRTIQFIECPQDQEEKYQIYIAKLIQSLREDATYYEQHKLVLVKALKWEQQKRNPSILLRGFDLRLTEAWLKGATVRSQHPPTALQEEFIAESLKQPPEAALDVFISYSRADSDFARKLNSGLQIQNKTTWFDQESIASGEDFEQEIFKGIEKCNNFLFIISPHSIESPYCANEVEYAKKLNKRIVTVLYQKVNEENLHPVLASVQWIDFHNHNGDFFTNFGELTRTLDADPEYIRNHTRILLKAMEWQREGKDDSFLLRGKDLKAGEEWLAQSVNKEPSPTELQRQYLNASQELPKRKVKLRTVLFTSLAVTALVCTARWFGLMQWTELAAYDQLLRMRPGNEAPDDRFLIVGVDEDSINQFQKKYEPTWGTLPDQALDDLLKVLNQHQPRLIGLDFLRDYAAKPEVAARMKQTQNLIAICKSSADDRSTNVRGVSPPPEVPNERVGFSNLVLDNGNIARRQLLLQPPDSKFCNTLDAFSLVMARKYLEAQGKPYTSPLNQEGTDITKNMQFGNTAIVRLAGKGSGYQNMDQLMGYQTLINFRAPKGDARNFARVVSLKDLLENRVPTEVIRDRIVLIGFTANTHTATDIYNSPYGEMPGVILHGQMTSQLIGAVLDGRPLIWWWSDWGGALWIFAWSLVGGIIVCRISQASHLASASIASLLVLYLTSYGMLAYGSGWIPLVPPAIALVITGTSVGYFTYRLRHP
ncbi:TIR domain-containing protein [Aerosakkonemataceae cyanobacterium BLCC-F50]|uniref:TIR domain-containing protein n=1 Tax=Floridaenema flaviceps BLCC-F50 TaxID=3153642 RepID=A0ABV4XPN4_9CYAN